LRDGLLPGMGCSGAWCRTVDPRIKAGEGRRVRYALASAVLAATRVPKAEMEEPTFGALATERLAERGARIETHQPTADNFAKGIAKGELGSLTDPLRRCTTAERRRADPIPGGPEDQREG
jgi:hypothetical protein